MARRLRGPFAVSAALAATACLPAERPYWVIDHTDALSMRFEVVERGPFGSLEPASGGPVLEAMPGDRVRVVPFIAGPDGPVDVASLEPMFYACAGGNCGFGPREFADARPCETVQMPAVETCFLGAGAAVEFEVGPIQSLLQALSTGTSVLMLAGTPEGPDTRECARRLADSSERATSLRDCLLFSRSLRLGPLWRALLVAAATGVESPVPLDALPWQVTEVEPDVPPTIAGFNAWVTTADGGQRFVDVGLGGELSVRTGDEVGFSLVVGGAPQAYAVVSLNPGEAPDVSTYTEFRAAAWFSGAPAPFVLDSAQGLDVTWTAPDEPGEVFVYALLADVRSADVAWLRVTVEPR